MAERRTVARLYLAVSILLSLAGFGGFVLLFGRDFNVFWLILSPVIIALYQIPAVYFYWLYKRTKRQPGAEPEGEGGGPGSPPPGD